MKKIYNKAKAQPKENVTTIAKTYPSGVCTKKVDNRHNSLTCDACNHWIHVTTCTNVTKKSYDMRTILQRENLYIGFFCHKCEPAVIRETVPFMTQTNAIICKLYTSRTISKLERLKRYQATIHIDHQFPFGTIDDIDLTDIFKTQPTVNSISTGDALRPTVKEFEFPSNKDNLNILSMNCQRIVNKTTEIKNLVDELKPTIMLLQESWLTKDHNDSEIAISGYQTLRNDRQPK